MAGETVIHMLMSLQNALTRLTNIGYLVRLVRFTFRRHPSAYFAVGLGFLSVCIELAAMMSLLPLSVLTSGGALDPRSPWVGFLKLWGLSPDVPSMVVLFSFLLFIRVLTQFGNHTLIAYLSRRIQAELSSQAFERVVTDFSLRQIEEKTIGYYISLAGDETARAGSMVVTFNHLATSGFLAVLYYGSLYFFSPMTGLGVTIFLLVSFVSLLQSFRQSHRLGGEQLEQAQAAHSIFLDSLNGLRSVRALAAEAYVSERYRDIIQRYVRTHFHIEVLNILAWTLPALVLLSTLLALSVSGRIWNGGSIDFVFVVTIVLFLMRFFPAVGQCLTLSLKIIADAKAAKDVTSVVEHDEVTGVSQKTVLPGPVRSIALDEVSFCYRSGKPVLEKVTMEFVAGRSYAVVGPSGCGKSTLLDLILHFYPIDSGRITINGRDSSTMTSESLRSKILLLGQQTTVFNDTVANNVTFGKKADRGQIERACRLACIDQFLRDLPAGYDTMLAYQGSNLSGGQRQRIGIARALLREPDVLLLDEATNALDAGIREQLVSNLTAEFKDRILLFVTHDPFVTSRVHEVLDLPVVNHAPAHKHPALELALGGEGPALG